MAISTAAAIIGATVIKAGTAAYGAGQAKKANRTATTAANAANAANIAANRENRDYIAGLNQPKIAGGQGAFDMLLQEFGVGQPSQRQGGQPQGQPGVQTYKDSRRSDGGFAGTSPAQPQGQPQGGLDAQAYWDANPDLAADQSLSGFNPGDLTGDGTVDDADRGAWHYQNYGQNEGRNAPQMAPQEQAPEGPAPYDPMTAPPPQFQRREDVAMQDYGQAPNASSYFDNFEEDPGAAYRRSEALNGVNAYSAARGKLRSGDAAKSLATLASNLGAQEYSNWFNRQSSRLAADRGQFNSNRSFAGNLYSEQNNRADSRFGDDRAYGTNLWEDARNYATNRTDNRVNNLFRVSGVGDNAIRNVTDAGNNFTNATREDNGNTAGIIGNSAINRANANTDMWTGIGGAISSGINAWGGGAGRSAGGGGYAVPSDLAARGFVNTPGSINVTRPF